MFTKRLYVVLIGTVGLVVTLPAIAQWSVIDAPATAQLIQEVRTMEQALQITRTHLAIANQTLQSMSGDRGMERLESGIARNYLPSSWAQVFEGVGGYPTFRSDVSRAVAANAVLTPALLTALSESDRNRVTARRQSAAVQQALSQEALVNTSGRFASIQRLIAAIPKATDQKSILDLQARIGAEVGMLQNEQTKLQVLRQVSQAQDAVHLQQELEQSMVAQGQFASRFQPVPPP